MSPKELYYFLGKCLALDELPQLRQDILEQVSKPGFSWEQFVRVGSSHLVLPALYCKLRNSDLVSQLPPELTAHLKEIHTLNTERNKGLLKQIHWLNSLLFQEGIRAVFLKGSGALLGDLYSDPGERVLSDIDCLVREGDFDDAVNLVKGEGYTHPPFLPEKLPLMHHYPSLFKTNEPAQIEIHKIPVGKRQLKHLNLEDMWSACAQPGEKDGPWILSGTDQILINVIHSQLKDRGQFYANIPLRNIYEFYRLSCCFELPTSKSLKPRMKRVLNNYMYVAEKLFTPTESFPLKKSLSSRVFIRRFELNKTSRIYNRLGKFFRTLTEILYTYLYIISKALMHKEYRSYLRINLTSLAWYRRHVSVIRKRF
jgi:hypothetical protein